jgi:hypothetical protein
MNNESKPAPKVASDEPPKAEGIKTDPKPENPPNPPPIIPPAEQRPENQCDSDEKWDNLTRWGKFERMAKVVEFAGIIGALIFICVQWSDINATSQDVGQAINLISNQVVSAQSQSKTLQDQASIMQGQSQILTGEWQAMQGQLEEMKRTRTLDERAWVFVTTPDNALTFSVTNAVLNARMKNVGKTPALITSQYGFFTENSADIKPHDPIGSKGSLNRVGNG